MLSWQPHYLVSLFVMSNTTTSLSLAGALQEASDELQCLCYLFLVNYIDSPFYYFVLASHYFNVIVIDEYVDKRRRNTSDHEVIHLNQQIMAGNDRTKVKGKEVIHNPHNRLQVEPSLQIKNPYY